jgi:hypothetical protein
MRFRKPGAVQCSAVQCSAELPRAEAVSLWDRAREEDDKRVGLINTEKERGEVECSVQC